MVRVFLKDGFQPDAFQTDAFQVDVSAAVEAVLPALTGDASGMVIFPVGDATGTLPALTGDATGNIQFQVITKGGGDYKPPKPPPHRRIGQMRGYLPRLFAEASGKVKPPRSAATLLTITAVADGRVANSGQFCDILPRIAGKGFGDSVSAGSGRGSVSLFDARANGSTVQSGKSTAEIRMFVGDGVGKYETFSDEQLEEILLILSEAA